MAPETALPGLPPRRLQLMSQPLEIRDAKKIHSNEPLSTFGAVHSRIGSSSLPEVQTFFDQRLFGSTVEPASLPASAQMGTRVQRLKGAQPCERRRPIEVPTDDPATQAAKIASTRTAAQMVGVSIEREALRQTPLERTKHVLRPGYRERGVAQEALLHALREDDERQRLAFRAERAEATRRRRRTWRGGDVPRADAILPAARRPPLPPIGAPSLQPAAALDWPTSEQHSSCDGVESHALGAARVRVHVDSVAEQLFVL
jgi:hypothetical protein